MMGIVVFYLAVMFFCDLGVVWEGRRWEVGVCSRGFVFPLV